LTWWPTFHAYHAMFEQLPILFIVYYMWFNCTKNGL